MVSRNFCSLVICLAGVEVNKLLIIIDLSLIASLLLVHKLLSLHLFVMSIKGLLLLVEPFLLSQILLSVHFLVLLVHVQRFDLLLVFGLLSLQLCSIDHLGSIGDVLNLFLMVVIVVIRLRNDVR